MTDHHLPPERPLSDQVRAQRKAELMQEISEARRGDRRWLVPTVAAAAVVAVVAVGGAVLANGDDPRPRPGAPAGSGSVAPSGDPETPTQAPSATPSHAMSGPDRLGDPGQSVPCGELQIPVRGAAEIAAIPIGETTVRLYGNDDTWITCDEWAAVNGGNATLFHPHAFGTPLQKDQLRISQNFAGEPDLVAEYVAGGALPDDVEAITYTFSDGHVEEATLADGMWAMAYFTDGEHSIIERAEVQVALADGSTERFTLRQMAGDFCAQSNHGC